MSDDVDAVLPELAALCKALANPSRLAVVLALAAAREMAVGELARATGQSQPSASHGLRLLRDAGMARGRADGTLRFHRVAMPRPLQDFIRRQIDAHALGRERKRRRASR